MKELILKEVKVDDRKVEYIFDVSEELQPYFDTKTMFIEYGTSVTEIPKSILTIPFVSSLLPLMWLCDGTMWVEEIDRTFYDCIFRLKAAYQELYAHYELKGRFIPAKTIYNTYEPEKECILLFSGGLDAHTSYIRNIEKTPVLCNIQGWYKNLVDIDKAAEADRQDISKFAKTQNVDFEFVKSNFAVVVNNTTFQKNIAKRLGDSWWHAFQHSMAFISITMPLAYKRKIKNIYIASSFSIGAKGKCASYATTDIEFKFAEHGGCIHDGFELSRQDKIHLLVEWQKKIEKDYPIRVCSFNDENCCKCEKCFRTILGIVAENGDIENFGFHIEGSLKKHFEGVMEERLYNYGIKGESTKHWPFIKKRMIENYEQIQEKEFVDWFMSYDFQGERKKALKKYYTKNFMKIIKRKVKERIKQ